MVKIMVLLASLLSVTIPENDTMVYFSLSESMGMRMFGGYNYLVEETKDGRVHFLFNKGYPDEKEYYTEDHSVFDSLGVIVRKYDMVNYKTDYNPEIPVTDGQSWSLYVKFASKITVRSGGYMAGPEGWRKAEKEFHECLKPWKEADVPVNELVRFKYFYGNVTYLVERKDDHALLTVDDEKEGTHEVYRKPLDMLEELRVMANTDDLKQSWVHKSDDPEHIPFGFELDYVDGDHYAYVSYDLKYQCHYTEVLQWFFHRWLNESKE